MTAWQDQPPISRRQVRQNERADAADTQLSLAQTPEEQPPVEAFPREGWHEDARRSPQPHGDQSGGSPSSDAAPQAQQPQAPTYSVRDFSPDSRRSSFSATPALNWAPPAAPGAPPVELDYHTQAAVPASSLASAPPPRVDDAGSGRRADPVIERTMTRREMRALEQSGVLRPVDDSPSLERSDVPRLRERVRNTSTAPEGDQSAKLSEALAEFDSLTSGADTATDATPPVFVEPPALVEPATTMYVASSTAVEEPIESDQATIEDHVVEATLEPETPTSGGWTLVSEAPAAEPVVAAEPAAAEPSWFDEIAEEHAVEDVADVEQPRAAVPAAESTAAADSTPGFQEAPSNFRFEELLFNAPVAHVSEPFVAQLEPEPQLEAEAAGDEHGDAQFSPQPVEPRPAPAEWLAAFPPVNAPGIVVPAPSAPTPFPIPPAAVVQETPAAESPIEPTPDSYPPVSYSPPVGHWSTQASIDDDEQVQENTFSRNVGATSGAITTNALVMPSIPSGDAILSPLGSTGEILITGSINLPSSMGTTGVHPARYDHSDVDALLEADDREDSDHPDSAPVRAIRAVSTHTSSGAVISAKKPKGDSRLPLVLAVSAAAMAVGVVVLFVVGMIFKIF